jgi:hypothetical protein
MASVAQKYADDVAAARGTLDNLKKSKLFATSVDGSFLAEITETGDLRLNDAAVRMEDVLALAKFITDNYS